MSDKVDYILRYTARFDGGWCLRRIFYPEGFRRRSERLVRLFDKFMNYFLSHH